MHHLHLPALQPPALKPSMIMHTVECFYTGIMSNPSCFSALERTKGPQVTMSFNPLFVHPFAPVKCPCPVVARKQNVITCLAEPTRTGRNQCLNHSTFGPTTSRTISSWNLTRVICSVAEATARLDRSSLIEGS